MARTYSDCFVSVICREKGHCLPDEGKCVRGPKLPEYNGLASRTNYRYSVYPFARAFMLSSGGASISDPDTFDPKRLRRGGGLIDCATSFACTHHGRCRFEEGECIFDRSRCESQPLQRECTLHAKRETLVRAESLPTSAQPLPDGEWSGLGDVELEGFLDELAGRPKRWLEPRGACGDHPQCFTEGLCSPKGTGCVARRVLDCLYSDACRNESRCRPEGGRCAAGGGLRGLVLDDVTQAQRDIILREQTKTLRHPAAPVGTGPGARKTWFGANLLDCRHSELCRVKGLCHHWFDVCVAGADGACRQSRACEDEGRCVHHEHRCVSPTSKP